nr:unnamed protein product [Naegleria fowleri]
MSLDLTSTPSLPALLPAGSHKQDKSERKHFPERRVKRELTLWNGITTNLGDQQFCFGESNTNRIQSIIITNEDDSEKIITALHLSDKLIHILVNYELKQIIRFASNDVKILCHHIYQRKKNKISIILSCSDSNIYLFEVLKKEKKRKNTQRKSMQSASKQTPSIFSRVDPCDVKSFSSDWKDYFTSSEGIIIKEISDSDVLQKLPEPIYQIQSIEPEVIQNLVGEQPKRSSRHILLFSKMQIYKMFQDEVSDELKLVPHCKTPSVVHSRVTCLYYPTNTSKISQLSDQNSYLLTEGFFQALFGSEFILMSSCICLIGCEDGSIFCFPSNKNIIDRFSEMSCYRTILTVRNSVQNIIPLSISINTDNERYNSIICVSVIKLFDSVELREIPSESNISVFHEFKAKKYHPFHFHSFPNTELSLSQLTFSPQDEKKKHMRAKGACTVFTKSGNLEHIIIPSHTAIDDWLCHSVAPNRLQNGIRDMIQQVDESFTVLDASKREQEHLNREIYTLNTAMHLLHEWKEQGKRISSNIKCFTRKEDIQPVMECSVYNGTDFVLTNQWSSKYFQYNGLVTTPIMQLVVIVLVDWHHHNLMCYSFPINHLDSTSTWMRTIPITFHSGHSSFNVSIILSFNQTEGHFSLVLKEQRFNLMDLLDTTLEQSTPRSHAYLSVPSPNNMRSTSMRLRSLFQKYYKNKSIPYFDHLNTLLTSTISHSFKLKMNPLEDRYTMNWERMLRIPLEEISSLSQDDWAAFIDSREATLSSNNFATPSLLKTPSGEHLKLKISTSLGGQAFDVFLQSNQFGCLLASRAAFLEKLKQYLLVRQKIDFTLASYPRITPKEEIIETIKSLQNIQTAASQLLAEFEQVEELWHSLHSKRDKNHSDATVVSTPNTPLLTLLHQLNSLDKKIVETMKELRQTKCGL